MRRFPRAFAFMIMAISLTAAGQSLPPGMTMHRTQAGALDADGWTEARSTAGNFSVRLPCLFNDFTTEAEGAGPMLKAYTLGCRRSDQRKFAATRIVYKDGARVAEEYFAKLRRGDDLPGTASITTLDFKGFKALELVDNSRCVFARYVRVEDDMIILIVEAPRSEYDGLKEQSDKFFASMNVDSR